MNVSLNIHNRLYSPNVRRAQLNYSKTGKVDSDNLQLERPQNATLNEKEMTDYREDSLDSRKYRPLSSKAGHSMTLTNQALKINQRNQSPEVSFSEGPSFAQMGKVSQPQMLTRVVKQYRTLVHDHVEPDVNLYNGRMQGSKSYVHGHSNSHGNGDHEIQQSRLN